MRNLSAYPNPPRSFSRIELRFIDIFPTNWFSRNLEIWSNFNLHNSDVQNIFCQVANYFFTIVIALPRFLLSHLQCLIFTVSVMILSRVLPRKYQSLLYVLHAFLNALTVQKSNKICRTNYVLFVFTVRARYPSIRRHSCFRLLPAATKLWPR